METKNDSTRLAHKNPKNIQLPQLEELSLSSGRRRTSAEMISEAKSFLSDVGATKNKKNLNQSSNGIFSLFFF